MAKQLDTRSFILMVKDEKATELKKEIVAYKHNFKELKHTPIKGFKFYQVEFKNRSERNALCDFCDYLNGFRDSPV